MGKDVGEALQDAAFTRTRLHGSTIEASYSGALSFLRRKYTKGLTGVDVAITGIPSLNLVFEPPVVDHRAMSITHTLLLLILTGLALSHCHSLRAESLI